MSSPPPPCGRPLDCVRTLTLWAYFTLGFVALFLPFYIAAHLTAQNRQAAFQDRKSVV